MGRKSRTESVKDAKRTDIVNTAGKLFHQKGFDGATMDDIAAACEYTKKTIYRYFDGKDEILSAFAEKALIHLIDSFKDAMKTGKTGLERIRLSGKAYLDFYRDFPAEFSILRFSKNVDCSPVKPGEQSVKMAELQSELLGLFRATIEEGKADKTVRKDLDSGKMAIYIIGASISLVESISSSAGVYESFFGVGAEEMISFAMDMLCEAIRRK